jgi:hypothetical protein
LKRNDPALDAREQVEAERHGPDPKAQGHDPWLGAELHKYHMQQRRKDMADN